VKYKDPGVDERGQLVDRKVAWNLESGDSVLPRASMEGKRERRSKHSALLLRVLDSRARPNHIMKNRGKGKPPMMACKK
jgi:hypothetical protein